MFYLIKLAARNLKRNFFRTAIAIAAIAAVVAIVVFSRGIMVGFTESSFRLYIDNSLGHVRLTNEEYQGREALLSLNYTVDGTEDKTLEEMIAGLEEIEEAEHVLPRLRFGAMASVEGEMVNMAGIGADMNREESYGALGRDITVGRMPAARDEVLVGRGLARELGVEVDDRFTLVFSDSFQSLQGRTFTVAGIRDTGSPDIDNNFFWLPLEQAQDMLYLDGEVTEILIFGSSAEAAGTLNRVVSSQLQEWGVAARYSSAEWSRADPFVEMFLEYNDLMNVVYVFFILLGSVVVVSTLFMIIRERRTEIGMMAALGLKSRQIMQAFTLEGAMMGVVGSFLGAIIGGWINYRISITGIEVDALNRVVEGVDWMVDPVLYTAYDPENLIFSFFLGVIITTLSCLYPARSAAKLDPVDALKIDA